MKTIQPVLSRPFEDGTQDIYRFANDYGASVIRYMLSSGSGYGSLGADKGLFELSVIRFLGYGNEFYEQVFDTGITDGDVVGHLTPDEVQRILRQIERYGRS